MVCVVPAVRGPPREKRFAEMRRKLLLYGLPRPDVQEEVLFAEGDTVQFACQSVRPLGHPGALRSWMDTPGRPRTVRSVEVGHLRVPHRAVEDVERGAQESSGLARGGVSPLNV